MEKTVYFLGAGFSKEAGGLVQNEIIKTILDEDFTRDNERLIKAKNNFIGFLKEELHIYEAEHMRPYDALQLGIKMREEV